MASWTSWFKLPWGAQAIRFPAKQVDIGFGAGSPTSNVKASPGSVYFRTDPTGPGTSRYQKLTGTGNTGWRDNTPCHEEAALSTIAGSGTLTPSEGQSAYPVVGSGGAVTGVGLAAGTQVGQTILLYGTDATNTVQFADNAGNLKLGSATRTLALNDVLVLYWNGTNWLEVSFVANG